MSMISFVAGVAVGAGSMIAKEQFLDQKGDNGTSQEKQEAERLSDENEKLRSRLREAESQIDSLLAENDKLRCKSKDILDDTEDLRDDLDSAKKEIKRLTLQNDELSRKVQEYKDACDSYEQELNTLKK